MIGIYIAEAHARNQWPVRSGRFLGNAKEEAVDLDQTEDMLSRQRACKFMVDRFKWKHGFWVDDAPSNSFGESMRAWPMRCYMVDCMTLQVAVISEPDGADVNVKDFVERCRMFVSGSKEFAGKAAAAEARPAAASSGAGSSS